MARTAGKQVNLTIAGGGTELDRTVIEAIGDPLIHLLRNAVDHGLETPEARPSFPGSRRALRRPRAQTSRFRWRGR